MKRISIMIPCFNEEENIIPLSEAITNEMNTFLPQYDYEIIFIDNDSQDSTREKIISLCQSDKRIKSIFNARNFGYFNSQYYGILQTTGDCVIPFAADFQDPVDMIPKLVHEWESGFKIVCAVKNASRENPIMRFARTCYYKTIKKMSDVKQIEHFYGFGLYDKEFIDVLRSMNDSMPYFRGIVAELGYKIKVVNYEQQKRRFGKTHFSFYKLYDGAMLGFTSYTKVGMRICTMMGFVVAFINALIAMYFLIYKLIAWDNFNPGSASMLVGIFLMGGLQMFFTGFLGEYVLSINTRVMNRPLVIEEKRLNFENESSDSINDTIHN